MIILYVLNHMIENLNHRLVDVNSWIMNIEFYLQLNNENGDHNINALIMLCSSDSSFLFHLFFV